MPSTPIIDPRAYETTWPWYHSSFDGKLTPRGRELLESCGVPAEDVEKHIYNIRTEAWKVFPFPCIGEFFFIEFAISHHPRYHDVIESLAKSQADGAIGQTKIRSITSGTSVHDAVTRSILETPHQTRLLDVGTCVGQDLRMLRFDGAPSNALYGTDLFEKFETVGHSLFLDKDKFSDHFIAADVLEDADHSPLNQTAGLWDFVTATMFLHQFDLPTQKKIAARLIRLLRPVSGSMILGNNTGQLQPTEIALKPPLCAEGEKKTLYRHSRETMEAMWQDVINDLGGPKDVWRISCQYDEREIKKREDERSQRGEVRFFQGDGQRRIFFTVEHL